jgi:hypothetical protein
LADGKRRKAGQSTPGRKLLSGVVFSCEVVKSGLDEIFAGSDSTRDRPPMWPKINQEKYSCQEKILIELRSLCWITDNLTGLTGKLREFALSSGATARLFLLMVKFCFKVSSGTKVNIFLQLPRNDESEVRVPTE